MTHWISTPLLHGSVSPKATTLTHSLTASAAMACFNRLSCIKAKSLGGRNRYRACKTAGYHFSAKDFTELPPGKDPFEFVFAENVARRHLTGDQKKALVIRLIRERPKDNDRKIASLVGVSNKTVWTYRKELEEAFEEFVKAWRDLDLTQRKEFVMQCRHELVQAGAV
jgi:hypothetical protein